MHAARLSRVYLLHGTFVGADALGILREVARVSPATSEWLGTLQREALERLTQDAGNYTQAYTEQLTRTLEVPVERFPWSSENHHIGRADAAVRLLHAVGIAHPPPHGGRVMLWGHSHGGNVLALLTNLLAGDRRINERFFAAARSYYRWPVLGKVDFPVWSEVRDALRHGRMQVAPEQLDLVTFGTPVRYGWDSGGYGRLLHFVFHRCRAGLPPHRAAFPPTLDEVRSAEGGDCFQHIGIAGTNFAPAAWAWRAGLADLRLGRLLQRGVRRRDLFTHLRLGVRAHQEGDTFLVDYGKLGDNLAEHMAGHAVYTRARWLDFHVGQIARHWYSGRAA